MATRQPAVMRSIQQLFHHGPVTGLDDGQLLERFVSRRDEAAFAALVASHGPLVLGVCRRILRDAHDVEDAFQATFLVLVRRAGSIRDAGRLGPWLHGVARRVAMRARSEASRRRSRHCEQPAAEEEESAMGPGEEADRAALLGIIDHEVELLPAPYREAVVLCDLEGRSYAEAALRLRCPLGTLQSRLARGRARLRDRLVRRGLAPVVLGVILADGASAAVPETLAQETIRAAIATAMGKTVAVGAISATVDALAGSVMRSTIMMTMKNVALAFAAVSIVIGAGLVANEAQSNTTTAQPPAAPVVQPKPAEEPKSGRELKLEVIGASDRSPLAGANVWVRFTRGGTRVLQGATDEEGHYSIPLPEDTTYFLTVAVAHPGYVPIGFRWDGPKIPESYTLAMERGSTIGGSVRDEQGRPIEGARVLPEIGISMGSEVVGARTDARGRWLSDALADSVGPGVKVELRVTHPDHVTLGQVITAEEARAQATVQVMKTGGSVSGTVLSPTGRPVAGATVVVMYRHGDGKFGRLRTGEDGRFRSGRFLDPLWSEVMLTVQAEGFASVLRPLTNTPEIPPQVIKLTQRQPLRGRVVDSQGRPVPGAFVTPTSELGNGELDWEGMTDGEGRFQWLEAPTSGTIQLNVLKPSFRQILGREIDAGAREITLTLHRAQHWHGTATDAETNRPIERFTLIPGSGPLLPGMHPDWRRDQSRVYTSGRFDLTGELTFDQDTRSSIRIEADGYESGDLIGFADNAEDVTHDFRLRKSPREAEPLTGIVHGPDGRPLAGAGVILCLPGDDVRIENGRLTEGGARTPAIRFETDRDGRYTFRPQAGPASIVAAHDAGFAFRTPEQLAASADVTLAAWGRIEGVMKVGTRPASRRKVAAWHHDTGPLNRVDYDILTDDDGRFIFERVMPGPMTAYRYVNDEDHHGWTASNPIRVDVKPGETARIQVGGTGRPIIGRLAMPEGISLANFVLGHGGNLSTEWVPPPTPDDYVDWSDERQSSWWQDFRQTPEGRAYIQDPGRLDREYAVTIRPEGTFRIEDVPAGRYVLKLPFSGNTGDNFSDRLALGGRQGDRPRDPRRPQRCPTRHRSDPAGRLPLPGVERRRPRAGDRGESGRRTAPRPGGPSRQVCPPGLLGEPPGSVDRALSRGDREGIRP